MRTQTSTRWLIALAITTTAIAPALATPTRQPDQSVQVTVTAGKARLGITTLQISAELRQHLHAPADRGVLVDGVRADSPADRAGLEVGDIVVEVDKASIRAATDILDVVSQRKKGDSVPLTIIRDGRTLVLQVTLVDDPGASGGMQHFDIGGTQMPNEFRQWFHDSGDFGSPALEEMRRTLEDLRKRMDELERRSTAPRT